MFARVVAIVLPVFVVIGVGYLFARIRGERVRAEMGALNSVNLNVLAPLMCFSALASKDFNLAAYVPLVYGSAIVIGVSGLLAWPIARIAGFDPRTFVPPMMFNNCGNMGLPLAVLAYGAAGFSPMVALFTISNLLHFTLGVWIINHHARFIYLLRNPMVIATIVGFGFAVWHPPLPDWLSVAIKMVGDALIPMMLLSLGVRLFEVRWDDWQIGAVGGFVCPLTGLAVAAVFSWATGMDRMQQGLLLLFGALPPAVLNFMVAEQFRQEPAKVASIVLIGNVLSIAFVPLGLALALR